MTRDEVRKLAELAGWTPTQLDMASESEWGRLMAFSALIKSYASEAMLDRIRPMIVQAEERGAKEEREACAKVCDDKASKVFDHAKGPYIKMAADIRARSAA